MDSFVGSIRIASSLKRHTTHASLHVHHPGEQLDMQTIQLNASYLRNHANQGEGLRQTKENFIFRKIIY
jgi:hypothetical protein